jgi:hypothetical protein
MCLVTADLNYIKVNELLLGKIASCTNPVFYTSYFLSLTAFPNWWPNYGSETLLKMKFGRSSLRYRTIIDISGIMICDGVPSLQGPSLTAVSLGFEC